MSAETPMRPGAVLRARAWGVHLFTASGAVVGLLALRATAGGDLRGAALWMLAALVIDGLDGTLARRWRVGEAVPEVDGRRLDDIVDYLNYVVVPAFFLVWADLVPSWGWVALPVLASAYGFSRADAKTPDHHFLGFPSYWNVVAIYAWQLGTTRPVVAAWLTGLALAVFLPIKFLYPSRMRGALGVAMNVGAGVWLLMVAAVVIFPELPGRLLVAWLSLAYPATYVALSLTHGGIHRRPDARP